jgi:hypothetical protein
MEIKDVLERLTSRKASEEAIREIIEYHVTAALKATIEKATIETKCYEFGDMDEYHVINKDSIINAYPLTNIK